MSGLGLAAVGYQMGKQIDYENRQRDYRTAEMDAEQPGLQDAAAARASGNQLRTSQNTAELGLVPQRAKLAGSQLGLQQGQADLQTELQPRQRQTARQTVGMQGQASDQEFKDFGEKLRQDRVSNAIGTQEVNDKALTKLADILHTSQSPEAAVSFYNAIVDSGALGDMPGPKATAVRMGKGPNGQEEITFLSGDKRIFGMDQATMGRYLSRGQKADLKILKSGESLVGVNPRTGQPTEMYRAPESAVEKLSKQPAEVSIMKYMVETGIAKDPTEAFNKMRTARGKSKAEFIADFMKATILPGMSQDAMREQESNLGAMYDRLNGGGRAAGSNTGAANTLDPKVQSLFE